MPDGRHMNTLHWGVGTPWDHEFDYWRRGARPCTRRRSGLARRHGHGLALTPYDCQRRRGHRPERVGDRGGELGSTVLSPLRLRDERFAGTRGARIRRARPRPPTTLPRGATYTILFTSAGATNVLWVWCPNIDPYGVHDKLARVYPGDSYVDWTCLDGYNFGNPWMSFEKLYARTYEHIVRIAPDKPMIVGEVGSTERGGIKAHWIHNMFQALATRFPHIHGLLWYDVYAPNHLNPGHFRDWPIETSKSSSTAFNSGIAQTLGRACRGLSGGARTHCLGRATP